ncbi:MAG TPA: hypothetical protein ENI79_04015 [Rhodospirillales bacterium]|nr:hypothetical protein [Rhodospirillales bacterium]
MVMSMSNLRLGVVGLSLILLVYGLARMEAPVTITAKPAHILAYHDITPKPQDSWSRTPKRLETDFRLLAEKGVKVIKLETYIESVLKGASLPDSWVVITFDDGAAGQFRYARPLLKRFGYPATFYVNTDGRAGSMTVENLAQLVGEGFQVASHGKSHTPFTKLSLKQARREIKQSLEFLRGKLGVETQDFCLPNGLYRPEHEPLFVEMGLRSIALTTTDHGPGHPDLIKIRRLEVKRDTKSIEMLARVLGRTRQ